MAENKKDDTVRLNGYSICKYLRILGSNFPPPPVPMHATSHNNFRQSVRFMPNINTASAAETS